MAEDAKILDQDGQQLAIGKVVPRDNQEVVLAPKRQDIDYIRISEQAAALLIRGSSPIGIESASVERDEYSKEDRLVLKLRS